MVVRRSIATQSPPVDDLGTQDGLPVPQRYWAIATVALGIIMAVMDSAIANVALPTIARDLHTDPAMSVWVVISRLSMFSVSS